MVSERYTMLTEKVTIIARTALDGFGSPGLVRRRARGASPPGCSLVFEERLGEGAESSRSLRDGDVSSSVGNGTFIAAFVMREEYNAGTSS